jgi:Uma2 family endonuclease
VDEYWLIDPHHREIMVFHLTAGKYDDGIRFVSRQKLRSEILPGFVAPTRYPISLSDHAFS